MGRHARRNRVPARPERGPGGVRRSDLQDISGAGVVLVGLFSARQKDYANLMDEASVRVASLGGRVMARFVQRRGVSDGGAAAMSRPFSRQTLVSEGKAREIAAACESCGADAVVFLNALSPHQQQALAQLSGRPVVTLGDAGGLVSGGGRLLPGMSGSQICRAPERLDHRRAAAR